MLNQRRLSAVVVAVSMTVASQALWAASSAELQLTNLQYTLTDTLTGGASAKPLTLTAPTGSSYVDGELALFAAVSQSEPSNNVFLSESWNAPSALTPSKDERLDASLPEGSASISVQTSAGQTRINAQGQLVSSGHFGADGRFEQGNKGLFFGPSDLGLFLPANTTLTVSTNAAGVVQIDGNCTPSTGLGTPTCEYANAQAYLELRYYDLNGEAIISWADFSLVQLTELTGQGARQSQNKLMSVSLTNPTEKAVQVGFRYTFQIDGESVTPAVPELSRTAMMLVGLLLLGGAAARTRRNRG